MNYEFKLTMNVSNSQLLDELCQCGSNEKYRDCCLTRKPRTTSLETKTIIASKKTGLNAPSPSLLPKIVVQKNGSKTLYLDDDERIESSFNVGYERSKNRKILLSMSNARTTDILSVLSEFDYIFAVDTNTKQIANEVYSATTVVECRIITNGAKYEVSTKPLQPYVTKDITEDNEKYGWLFAIELIKKEIQNDSSVALIVDSYLGEHESLNKRTVPILYNYFLPANFRLFYASADSGQEMLPNKLVKLCDKISTLCLDDLLNDLQNG